MNLLSSRNNKTGLVILCVSICICFLSFKSEITNDKTEESFLRLCEKSDAYYTHFYKDITYIRNWSRYKKEVSISNKLVVNSTKGVDEYAFLNLSEYESNHLEKIKIRTLKADGSIIDLDSNLVFKKSSKKEKFGPVNYPIPGVEPGDTIETNYVYYENLKKFDMVDYVDLYSDLPSFNSEFTIKTSPDLTVRYKSYNGFPNPGVISNDSLLYLQFSMNNIKGVEQNEHHCLPCEKPYLYYSVENKDSKLRTWKDVYNEEFNFLTQPMSLDYEKSSYYKRWKRRIIGTEKDSSKYYKFNLLHADVLSNFQMGPVQNEEIIKSSGYFLKNKRFDLVSIRRFYRQLLEDLEIDYWAVFARDKHLGPIDTDYIRRGEFGHMFFAFENEQGKIVFLYPHEEVFMYQIDEIPTSLYSTKAVLVKPYQQKKKKKSDKFIARDLKLATVDSVTIATIKLPGMNANYNYMSQMISSEVDIEKKETTFRYRFKISGGLSTELRSFYDMLSQNEEMSDYYDALSEFEGSDNTIQIDTVLSRTQNGNKPFTFSMSGEGILNDAITFINDSLVNISIEKLIQHNKLERNSDNSELNYYLDYNYSDSFILFINFPCDIDVLSLENRNVDFKNDFGEYFFELNKTKPNQLKLHSNYKILQNLIPKEKLNDITLLNDRVKNTKSKRLVVKLKKL